MEARRLAADSSSPPGVVESAFALCACALRVSGRSSLTVPSSVSSNIAPKRGADSEPRPAARPALMVVTLEEISRERALAEARSLLPRLNSAALSAPDCFSLLVSEQQLATALDLGRLFNLDLSPCFRQLARNVLARVPLLGGGEQFGEPGEAGLATLVRKYDSRSTCHRYGLAVASVWLESTSRMPAWLFAQIEAHHPEALLQLLISHRRPEEALKVALTILQDRRASLPLALLDKLRMTLEHQHNKFELEQAFEHAIKERS